KGNDRALMVGMEIPPVGCRDHCAFVPDERLVNPGTVHVAAQKGTAAIVFGDQAVAVVEEADDPRRRRHLIEMAEWVVAQRGVLRAARTGEPIFGVVAERGGAVR